MSATVLANLVIDLWTVLSLCVSLKETKSKIYFIITADILKPIYTVKVEQEITC